ncbi:Bug family tripartite tricarboxylate transporter substrate binding protein [Ramlibacter sp.]|uniref:Bug family tripartite tricarboxylate transporter substrate binding protein n=1 Tax=Ramlibacter sp. TaxID=1917967 RepID=UPI003D0AED51
MSLANRDRASHRRDFLLAGAALAATVTAPLPASAQSRVWTPSRQVTLIVPFSPGGSADLTARTLAPKLSELWGQPVVVENRAGASSAIGTNLVARAPGDGTSLLVTANGILLTPYLIKSLPYNLEKDLVPVGSLAFASMLLVSSTNTPDKSLREFVAAGGARSIGYSDGFSQLIATRLAVTTGKKFVLVPYKGAGPLVNDLYGGQVNAGLVSVLAGNNLLKSGKVNAIAVLADDRSKLLPEVPTSSEQGIKGMTTPLWIAVFASGTTPPAVQQQINADLRTALADPAVRANLSKSGADLSTEDLDQFRRRYLAEMEETKGFVKHANFVAE